MSCHVRGAPNARGWDYKSLPYDESDEA
jgi:hypothetical protein